MKSMRVIAYVDGFSLYFGMKEKGWRRYYWLNVRSLCQKLLRPDQHLVGVKYFTSRIKKSSPEKRRRQSTYIDALNATGGVAPFYGKYQWTPIKCRQCGHEDELPEEKMTDVQLAVEMVSDAYGNDFDMALLVTGDADLTPSIEKIRAVFPHKRVLVAFPPLRTNDELRRVASAFVHVTDTILGQCQLPDDIPTTGGYKLRRPAEWT